MVIRRLLDDPLTWAAGVALVALWCMGQALVGEPGQPVESLPPARYVVAAPVVAGATDPLEVPQPSLVVRPAAPLERVAPATSLEGLGG